MLIIDIFSYLFPSLALVGMVLFIFLVIFRFISNLNKRVKGIILTIVFSLLFILFLVAFIIDKFVIANPTILYDPIYYIVLMASSILPVIFGLYLIFKYRDYGFSKTIKKKMVYTYNKKNEYVYIIYKYLDNIYLLKDINSGIKYKLKNNEFSDEVVIKLNNNFSFYTEKNLNKNGIVRVKGEKVDDIYYCYVINFNTEIRDNKFEMYNIYNLNDVTMTDLDRFIILNNLMKSDFDIEY